MRVCVYVDRRNRKRKKIQREAKMMRKRRKKIWRKERESNNNNKKKRPSLKKRKKKHAHQTYMYKNKITLLTVQCNLFLNSKRKKTTTENEKIVVYCFSSDLFRLSTFIKVVVFQSTLKCKNKTKKTTKFDYSLFFFAVLNNYDDLQNIYDMFWQYLIRTVFNWK